MTELPPDLARLRAILRYLDEQLAGNETVGIYLLLQRDAARIALAAAERRAAPQRPSRPRRAAPAPAPAPAPANGSASSAPQRTGYVIEPKKHPKHPAPALYHLADCTMPQRETSRITPDQIRLGLRDPLGILAACEFCGPGKKLDTGD
ncbi:DUF6233 domain-containing protein [Streptomyces sp. NPDC006739]|uniref:DUF6233 domain-containing protein n=1 Tax=Streptomyces sp. NPDC006739 TaxID=3364763 RepID=UPI0036B932D3